LDIVKTSYFFLNKQALIHKIKFLLQWHALIKHFSAFAGEIHRIPVVKIRHRKMSQSSFKPEIFQVTLKSRAQLSSVQCKYSYNERLTCHSSLSTSPDTALYPANRNKFSLCSTSTFFGPAL